MIQKEIIQEVAHMIICFEFYGKRIDCVIDPFTLAYFSSLDFNIPFDREDLSQWRTFHFTVN